MTRASLTSASSRSRLHNYDVSRTCRAGIVAIDIVVLHRSTPILIIDQSYHFLSITMQMRLYVNTYILCAAILYRHLTLALFNAIQNTSSRTHLIAKHLDLV